MAIASKILTATVFGPDGLPMPQVLLRFSLVQSDIGLAGHVAQVIYSQFTDVNGVATVSLIPTGALQQPDSYYLCEAVIPGQGLNRDLTLYTVGFYMPNANADLQDIATRPGEAINSDTLTDAQDTPLTIVTLTELWSLDVNFSTSDTISNASLSSGYGNSGFIATQQISAGPFELTFQLSASQIASFGISTNATGVITQTLVDVIRFDINGSDFDVILDDTTTIFSGTYTGSEVFRIAVDEGGFVTFYVDDVRSGTVVQLATAFGTWYLAAALATPGQGIDTMILAGESIA